MAIDARKNFCKSTFEGASGINAAATEVTVADASNFPAPASGNYNLVIWNITDYANPSDAFANSAAEIVRATGLSTNTFTITRAQESTTARAFNTTGKTYAVAMTLTAKTVTDIETDLAAKANDADVVHDTGAETIAGVKTFSSDPIIPDEAYGAGWNGSLEPPTKNAVYDKIETIGGGGGEWTLVSSGAISADPTTISSLDLETAQRYKLVIEVNGNTANPTLRINGKSDEYNHLLEYSYGLTNNSVSYNNQYTNNGNSSWRLIQHGSASTCDNKHIEVVLEKLASNAIIGTLHGYAVDSDDVRDREYVSGLLTVGPITGGAYTTNVTSISILAVTSGGRYWLYGVTDTV